MLTKLDRSGKKELRQIRKRLDESGYAAIREVYSCKAKVTHIDKRPRRWVDEVGNQTSTKLAIKFKAPQVAGEFYAPVWLEDTPKFFKALMDGINCHNEGKYLVVDDEYHHDFIIGVIPEDKYAQLSDEDQIKTPQISVLGDASDELISTADVFEGLTLNTKKGGLEIKKKAVKDDQPVKSSSKSAFDTLEEIGVSS